MSEELNLPIDLLLLAATRTGAGIAAAVAGEPADSQAILSAEMALGVATLLEQLAHALTAQQQKVARHDAALGRIARLEIRSAAELLELGAWRKITGELQAIAQDTIGQPRRGLKRTEQELVAPRDAGKTDGIGY